MGAALHLAHAHQLPAPPKRKRGGGGGNGHEFREYARRIYSDDRADPQARELLLAVAYAVTTAAADDGPAQWALVRQALGRSRGHRSRQNELVSRDVPRYIPPNLMPASHDNLLRICSAPRLRPYRTHPRMSWAEADIAAQARRDDEDFRNVHGICGEATSDCVLEKLPGAGWHKLHYFCQRHRDHLVRVRAQVEEGNRLAPEPVPNVGGLLPSYFDSDWLKCYRHYRGEDWQPPVYGVRADDWPVPGREPVAPRARLRLAAVDGELLGI